MRELRGSWKSAWKYVPSRIQVFALRKVVQSPLLSSDTAVVVVGAARSSIKNEKLEKRLRRGCEPEFVKASVGIRQCLETLVLLSVPLIALASSQLAVPVPRLERPSPSMHRHRLALPLVAAILGVTTVGHGFLVSPALHSCKASHQRDTQTIAAASRKQLGQQGGIEHAVHVKVGVGYNFPEHSPTQACVSACLGAYDNTSPPVEEMVPGGYDFMKLRVQLAVPVPEEEVDVEAIKKVLPYGELLPIEFQHGGMLTPSANIEDDTDMITAISCITLGYGFHVSPDIRSIRARRAGGGGGTGARSGKGGMKQAVHMMFGFGHDHGESTQNPTEACIRACIDAVESPPKEMAEGGIEGMKLRVQLAVPASEEEVDVEAIKKLFPYDELMPIEFQRGGMRASSAKLGDDTETMIAISCVSVGY